MKENQKEENLIIKKKPEQLSRTKRFMIFLILYLMSILINNEQFIFSQHRKALIDKKIRINNINIFLCHTSGFLLGELIFIKISQIENRKKVTFICYLINGLLFFIYALSENKIIFYCCRFLIRLFKNYKFIFVPVWIDQIGIKKYKTILMFLYLHFNIRQIINIIFQKKMNSNKWYLNSIIFGTLIIAFDCLLLIFPEKYFSLKLNFIGYKSDKKEEYIISNDPKKISFFEEKEEKNNKTGFLKTIKKNKVYIFSILTNFFHSIFYRVVILNIISYLITLNKYTNPYDQISMIQATGNLSDLALFLGKIFEIICLSCIGGYENKNSAIFLGISSILNFIFSLFLIFSNNSLLLTLGFLLYLFLSSIIPFIIDCFIINLLPNKYKGCGFALNLLIENIGNTIAPIIYGLMQDYFGKHNPTLPWKININFILLETTFCLVTSYYRYYYKEEIKDDNEKELEIIA